MASGSTQVKYLAIYQKIKQQILDGEYKVNEKIPSSPILAEEFDVSVLTIKKALDLLVRDGYIIRRRGSGTVVQDWHQQEKARMIQTLTGTKAVYGSEVESKIIEFVIVGADVTIAGNWGLQPAILSIKSSASASFTVFQRLWSILGCRFRSYQVLKLRF